MSDFAHIRQNSVLPVIVIVHKIHTKQVVPLSLTEAWGFFSSPKNLKTITPDHLGFEILEGGDDEMYPGLIIRYKVSPLLGIKLEWVTEITQVTDERFFIDEQRFGPYAFWHHKHFFSQVENGTLVEDLVHYKLPFGFLGTIMHALVVRKQLKDIFHYREKKLKELFG